MVSAVYRPVDRRGQIRRTFNATEIPQEWVTLARLCGQAEGNQVNDQPTLRGTAYRGQFSQPGIQGCWQSDVLSHITPHNRQLYTLIWRRYTSVAVRTPIGSPP